MGGGEDQQQAKATYIPGISTPFLHVRARSLSLSPHVSVIVSPIFQILSCRVGFFLLLNVDFLMDYNIIF